MFRIFSSLICLFLCASQANADMVVFVSGSAYKAQKSAQKHEQKMFKLQQEHIRKVSRQKVQVLAQSYRVVRVTTSPKVYFYYSK